MSGKNRLGHYDCLNTWQKSIRVKGTGIQGLGTHCTWLQAPTPSYSWNSSPHGPGIPGDPFLVVIPKPYISLLYPSACSASRFVSNGHLKFSMSKSELLISNSSSRFCSSYSPPTFVLL